MGLYANLFKSLLFSLSPEKSHKIGIFSLKASARIPGLSSILKKSFEVKNSSLAQNLWGKVFPNPVGLAAGFDKDGEVINQWETLGFGFFEIGTVTPKPQAGNPQPRIFRLSKDQALINRLGFNNKGADAVANRLEKIFAGGKKPSIPMGINIGKQKETSLEEAVKDYQYCLEKLYPYADYFTVNVSSPNTPGLRELQNKESLKALLGKLLEKGGKEKPLVVKLSPDLSEEELGELVEVLMQMGVAGVILTNTSLSRGNLTSNNAKEEGGLSGKPLGERSTQMIRLAKEVCGERLVIIGCGGINSAQNALEKLNAGARLVQIYTGLVYEGPSLPKRINQGLIKLDWSHS